MWQLWLLKLASVVFIGFYRGFSLLSWPSNASPTKNGLLRPYFSTSVFSYFHFLHESCFIYSPPDHVRHDLVA